MKLAAVAFRNIRRNRRRSLLSGLAIALSTLFIAFMFSLVGGMMRDYRSNVERYLTGHVRLRNRDYDANEQLNPLHLSVPGYEELVARLEAEKSLLFSQLFEPGRGPSFLVTLFLIPILIGLPSREDRPGLILAAYALMQRVPRPTEDELLTAMEGNICRCTGYASIVEAIRAAYREAAS
jgi:hypothetical protein